MSNPDYSTVPVYTGQLPAEQSSGFFQPPAPTAEGILATDQARAVAEVQAALVIAASRPRNELRARDRLLQACQRVKLASGAVYQYKRGGTAVSGPSIRLAEAAARAWGNMNYGFRELSRRPGESECEAYAWDLETNTKAVRQFSVRHRRDTKSGGYDLTDERDIYEIIANQAQRRVRAAILEIIPGDIMEDAVDECERTMNANVGNVAEAAAKLVQAFAEMGIPRESVEKRLGHRIEAIQAAQIIAFRKIYTSIKEGMSVPKDWFDLPEVVREAAGTEEAPAEADAPKEAVKETPAHRAEPEAAPKKATEEAPHQQAQQAVLSATPNAEAAPAPQPAQAMPTFECPRPTEDGISRMVDEAVCVNCPDRKGCPAWEEEF